MLTDLITLFLLILLQIVLSVDNLLYISLESRNAPLEKQKFVRNWGIGIAILLRIILLFILIHLVQYFQNPFLTFHWEGIAEGSVNIHSLIVLFGGGFIVYSSIKGIWNMLSMEEHTEAQIQKKNKTVGTIIALIVIMNLVFSFDSILSAMALTNVFWVMATAIVLSGILMMIISEKVSNFLKKNRMYEVLGLFILFLVGIMLLSEGGHIAELGFFGKKIAPMNKTTFYFILIILVAVDVVQSRYKKKLLKLKEVKDN